MRLRPERHPRGLAPQSLAAGGSRPWRPVGSFSVVASGGPGLHVPVPERRQLSVHLLHVLDRSVLLADAGKYDVRVTGGCGSPLSSVAALVNKGARRQRDSDSPDPSVVGQPVSVSWSVAVTAPGAGTPTGNVTVSDGAGNSCVAAVAAGSCSIVLPTAGAKTLTASYAGDANFNASSGNASPHRQQGSDDDEHRLRQPKPLRDRSACLGELPRLACLPWGGDAHRDGHGQRRPGRFVLGIRGDGELLALLPCCGRPHPDRLLRGRRQLRRVLGHGRAYGRQGGYRRHANVSPSPSGAASLCPSPGRWPPWPGSGNAHRSVTSTTAWRFVLPPSQRELPLSVPSGPAPSPSPTRRRQLDGASTNKAHTWGRRARPRRSSRTHPRPSVTGHRPRELVVAVVAPGSARPRGRSRSATAWARPAVRRGER